VYLRAQGCVPLRSIGHRAWGQRQMAADSGQQNPPNPPLRKVLQGFQWVELQDKWDSDTKLHYLLWPLIKSTSGPKL
jgi:hypothetical protein